MIKLCLEGAYCKECPAFKCECVEDAAVLYDGTRLRTDFFIKCENREQCRLIHDHVLRNKKGESK